ncbi:U3 small nucleolar ribonucleoprotein IMP3 [Enteropsectra breve]|nr:U3 small nucleolar ribonucleoprotein IMP3 [Enteropsectra breve]
MRKLKFHEQKLLKKVNFLEWSDTNTTREQQVISKFLLKSRDEYKRYNKIVGMIRKLAENLARLADNSPTKQQIGKQLISLLYDIGIIEHRKLLECTQVSVSDFCMRRLPMVMVQKKMLAKYCDADKFVQHGHVRLGAKTLNDTSTLISKAMEEFVTWTDSSKIRKKIDEFNDEYDDYKY